MRHEWNLGQNPDVEDMTGACQVQQEQNKRDDDDDTIAFHLKEHDMDVKHYHVITLIA